MKNLKTKFTFFLVLLISLNIFAQKHFEKGYIIDNEGNKKECLINNLDWKYNPKSIKYMDKAEGIEMIANVDEIQEFSIGNNILFQRFTVLMDRTTNNLNILKGKKDPEFHEETVLLKSIIKSDVSLYSYKESGLQRYFYQEADSLPIQLVYLRYIQGTNDVKENNLYKQQLLKLFKEFVINPSDLNDIEYNDADLTKIFINYNKSEENEMVQNKDVDRKVKYKLGINVASRFQKLTLNNNFNNYNHNIKFDGEFVLNPGFEMVLILPFNNDKWEFSFSPNFYQYKTVEKWDYIDTGTIVHTTEVEVDLSVIEIPFSLRYNLISNDNQKLFIGASLLYTKDFNSYIFDRMDNDRLKIEVIQAFDSSIKLGYEYKKFSLEFNYYLSNKLKAAGYSWDNEYTNFGIKGIYYFIK